jgi:hypothetical protein
MNAQANLFPVTVSSTSVVGLEVVLPKPCRQCGEGTAFIGSSRGPHHASLVCSCCEIHRGWVSGETYRFISAIIDNIGRPTERIVVSTNSHKRADTPQ